MEERPHTSRVVSIVQARMRSRLLPGKALLPLGEATVLEQITRRIRTARFGAHLIVATSDDPSDLPIRELCARRGYPCSVGALNDTLDRTVRAARQMNADIVVNCSVSNPLLDPKMLDACAQWAMDSGMDYVTVGRLPQGSACDAIPRAALEMAAASAQEARHREQAGAYLCAHPDRFDLAKLPSPPRLCSPEVRLALETAEDYRFLYRLWDEVEPRADGVVHLEDVLAYLKNRPAFLDRYGWKRPLRYAA